MLSLTSASCSVAINDVVIDVRVMHCHQAMDNSGFSTFLSFPLRVPILILLSCCINSSSLFPVAIWCTLATRKTRHLRCGIYKSKANQYCHSGLCCTSDCGHAYTWSSLGLSLRGRFICHATSFSSPCTWCAWYALESHERVRSAGTQHSASPARLLFAIGFCITALLERPRAAHVNAFLFARLADQDQCHSDGWALDSQHFHSTQSTTLIANIHVILDLAEQNKGSMAKPFSSMERFVDGGQELKSASFVSPLLFERQDRLRPLPFHSNCRKEITPRLDPENLDGNQKNLSHLLLFRTKHTNLRHTQIPKTNEELGDEDQRHPLRCLNRYENSSDSCGTVLETHFEAQRTDETICSLLLTKHDVSAGEFWF